MHLILFVVYQNMDRPVCNNDLRYYRDNLTYNKQSQGRKLNSQVVDLRLDGRKRTQESCAKSCHFCEAENRSYVLFFKFSKVTQMNGSLATMSSLAKDIIVYSFEKDIGGGRCLEAPWDRFFNIKGAQLHLLMFAGSPGSFANPDYYGLFSKQNVLSRATKHICAVVWMYLVVTILLFIGCIKKSP